MFYGSNLFEAAAAAAGASWLGVLPILFMFAAQICLPNSFISI